MSDIHEAFDRLEDLDYGPERTALAEEAVRQADLSGDEYMSFEARSKLVESAHMAGQSEKALAAFAWCQDYATKRPELDYHQRYTLAWQYKWMLSAALNFPQIPLSRIQQLHQGYAELAHSMGDGSASIPYMQLELAMHLGDQTGAKRALNAWELADYDALSDCPACEAQTRVRYQVFMDNDAAAVAEGQRIVDERQRCAEVPHLTYAALLMPLLRLGNTELARKYASNGRRLVAGKPDFLTAQAQHLQYFALTNLTAACKWYARHLPWAEATNEASVQLDYHAASALLFSLLKQAGKKTVKLELPTESQAWQASGEYDVLARLEYHYSEAQRIAKLFDERNSTNWHTQQLEKTMQLAQLAGTL